MAKPLVASVVLVAAILGISACGSSSKKQAATSTTTKVEVIKPSGSQSGFDPSQIYKQVAPGVVTVSSVFPAGRAEGSGFVISSEGEIVTNAHVVTDGLGAKAKAAKEVYVKFPDLNEVKADIRGYDLDSDIALLKIAKDGLNLRPLTLDTTVPAVGSPVAAIGSPFGEAQSLTVGIVSAVNRSVQSLTDFDISGAIQTDAAINPGNSGGPLVDANGDIIGVNQQINTSSGGNQGVGFAIPASVIKRSVEQLRSHGSVNDAYLGVASKTVYPQLAANYNLGVDRGAWVQQVSKGGPADKAGLKGGSGRGSFQADDYSPGGDVITKVGSTKIETADDLALAIDQLSPGTTVKIEYQRMRHRRTADVKLVERPLEVPASLGR